jgi:hypothetical protein
VIKYVVHPGFVTSCNDGQEHYITARDLVRLYGVNPAECGAVWPDDPSAIVGCDMTTLVHLYPRNDGDYKLPGGPA